MSKSGSLLFLPQLAFSWLCAAATWALVYCVGEGEQIRVMTDNPGYFLFLLAILPSFFAFEWYTRYMPEEFSPSIVKTSRIFLVIVCVSLLAILQVAFALMTLVWIGSENWLTRGALFTCYYIAKCAFFTFYLTVLVGGAFAIKIDLSTLVSGISRRNARYR